MSGKKAASFGSPLFVMFTFMLVLALVLMTNPAAQTQNAKPDVCPMRIEIDPNGQVFTHRFHGRYLTSLNLLAKDLHGGCYNDANPSAFASVTIKVEKGAPRQRIDAVMKLLADNGWPADKVIRK